MRQQQYIKIEKPQRWDYPYDPFIYEQDIEEIISCQLLSRVNQIHFPEKLSLKTIIKNDAAIQYFNPGEVIYKNGEYGQTAYILLQGEIAMSQDSQLPLRKNRSSPGFIYKLRQSFRQLFNSSLPPETRNIQSYQNNREKLARPGSSRYVLADSEQFFQKNDYQLIQAEDFFGENSAMKHQPRSETMIAKTDVKLCEIRWQGLKEILKRCPDLEGILEQSRRSRGNLDLLSKLSLFSHFHKRDLQQIDKTLIHEEYGDVKWYMNYQINEQDIGKDRLLHETLIVREGDHIDGLLIIRNGFVRASIDIGYGFHPLGYLSTGDFVGLQELKYHYQTGINAVWQCTLHAIGYAEILVLPGPVARQYLFANNQLKNYQKKADNNYAIVLHQQHMNLNQLPDNIYQHYQQSEYMPPSKSRQIDPDVSEFLISSRLINGSATMVIDLQRCIHCDDCVRACAMAHDNNPRFIRQGRQFRQWMFAHACMHCHDAPCLLDCPSGAIQRTSADGLTLIEDKLCIGCGNCAANCPYNAIQLVAISDRKGARVLNQNNEAIIKASKCDLCNEQLSAPVCESSCPQNALKRINWKQLGDALAWLQKT